MRDHANGYAHRKCTECGMDKYANCSVAQHHPRQMYRLPDRWFKYHCSQYFGNQPCRRSTGKYEVGNGLRSTGGDRPNCTPNAWALRYWIHRNNQRGIDASFDDTVAANRSLHIAVLRENKRYVMTQSRQNQLLIRWRDVNGRGNPPVFYMCLTNCEFL